MKLSEAVDLLGAKAHGTGFLAHCPAHFDSNPSLKVDVTPEGKLLIACRAGCTSAAVLEKLPRKLKLDGLELDMPNVVPAVKRSEPVSREKQTLMALYLSCARGNLSTEALEYAERRFGVNETLARELGLGFDEGGQFEADFLGLAYRDVPRLVVPFRDKEGIPRGFQGRDISEEQTAKAKWSGPSNPPEGGSWTRLGYFVSGSGVDFIVITEGPGDALTSVAAGIDSVGIRGVAHAEAVVEELAETLKGRRVVLAGDSDRAGKGMNEKLGTALSAKGLSVYLLETPGFNDLSEWFEADPESFAADYQKAVTTAKPFTATVTVAQPEEEDEEDLSTNVGAARRVLALFEGGVLYSEGLGFLVYRDGVWIRDPQGNSVRSKIHEISEELYIRALELEGLEVGKVKKRTAKRLRQTAFIDSVIKELKAMVPIESDRFDRKPDLLAFRNGVVDLRTGELLPHSKDYLLTHQLDINYNPEAECPRWLQFLDEVMKGDKELVSYLQRLVGYSVTGYTSEQCFAVLWGTGANGKSIFTDTLSYVFSDITSTTPFSTFEERQSGGIPNDIAALRGARLVFASEGERGKTMAEAVIKRVTGQDLITARFMREEFFSFRPTFLIFLGTNYKPAFKGQDEGLWRRVKLIPFRRFFAPDERDHYLGRKLEAEAEGIAAWSVAGAKLWLEDGLRDPSTVVDATKSYRDTSDALAGFYPDGPLTTGGKEDVVLGSVAYSHYKQWCDDEELPLKEQWSRKAFYEALEERGAERFRNSKGINLRGVKLSEPEPQVEPSGKKTIFDGAR